MFVLETPPFKFSFFSLVSCAMVLGGSAFGAWPADK